MSLDLSTVSTAKAVPLHQLASAIQEVLEDNFQGTHLLTAEIASLSDTNTRGHCYLELVDRNPFTGEETRLRATIWANRWRVISHYFTQETGQRLAKGLQILFEGQLTFHPTYGLSLNITNVDAGYTLGRQKQALEKIIAKLKEEGLLEKQQELTIEPVLQRIAVISSPSAAGYQDFVHQLQGNSYGYAFALTLFTATMQGADTESSVINALQAIERRITDFDAVAVIRGGGADQDLVGFNSYALGKALAEFSLPILTGIGHERDTTVPDMVAYHRLKTPTAVAEHLIELAALYEGEVDEVVSSITGKVSSYFLQQQNRLNRLETGFIGNVASYLPNQSTKLATLTQRLQAAAMRTLEGQQLFLSSLQKQVQLLNPKSQLKRGYALVYNDKGRAKTPKQLKGTLRIILDTGEAKGTFTPQ